MKASKNQIKYIRDLAQKAGYTGDTGYNAAEDLLGDGRGWSADVKKASALIEALKAKLAATADHAAPITATTDVPATPAQLAFCQRLWDEGRAAYAFTDVNGPTTKKAASEYIERFKNSRPIRRAEESTEHRFRRADGSMGTWTEY